MPRNVIFAAPFPTDITMRFVRAAARLPEVRLLGIVHTPPEGEDAAVYRDLVRVTDPLSTQDLIEATEILRRRHGHPDLLAHGFQVLIQTAAGAGLFPFLVEDSLIGFIEQSSRFLKPVYVGDTLYPQLKVSELKPQRTTGVLALASTVHNQKRELVMEGVQRYLIRKRAS